MSSKSSFPDSAEEPDFRVAVLQAQSTAFDFATPGLRFVQGSNPAGADELAGRVTVEPYRMRAADALAPYGNAGRFVVQVDEEPLAAGVLAFESLLDGLRAGAPLERRVREGARLVAFFVADETGNNDEQRYFSRTPARWGATYADRLRSAIAFFRTRGILTFGLVNDQRTDCAANVASDMRKCLITGNGGAYIPITSAAAADVASAMRRIVSAVVGASSPYRLERQPITSTLKVRVRNRDVPRSRADGFDCCSTSCVAGACAPPPCRPMSGACTSPSECCSASCSNGQCAPG